MTEFFARYFYYLSKTITQAFYGIKSKNRKMKNQFLIIPILIFTFLSIKPLHSQTMEMSMVPDSVTTIELEFARLLSENSNVSIISGNYGLQYKQVINHKFNFIGKVNLFHFNSDFGSAENSVSNVFLGFQYKPDHVSDINSALNVGIYLPVASRDVQSGIFYNFYDFPKYVHKATDIHVSYNSFFNYANGFRLGIELGSDILIPVGDNNGDIEVLGRYGLSLMYLSNSGVYLQSELLGVANMTNDGQGFDDSTFHTYAFGVGYRGDEIAVGLFYKNYFDELFGSSFDGILGIEFSSFL